MGKEITLLQTPSGWIFRELMSKYGEYASVQCFRRLAAFSDNGGFMKYREHLRSALGSHYMTRHELLLPFINQSDLRDINVLTGGCNGRVYSALWDRPQLAPGGHREGVGIVLKHIHARLGVTENTALTKFLDEVNSPNAGLILLDGNCSAGIE